MAPTRDMLNLLSDEEIAMILVIEPSWSLPNGVADSRPRMARAKAINQTAEAERARGGASLRGDSAFADTARRRRRQSRAALRAEIVAIWSTQLSNREAC